MTAAPIVDLNGQWVEDAFQHIDDHNYRRHLYAFLKKHRRYAILQIIMVTVESKGRQKQASTAKGRTQSEETRFKMRAAWTLERKAKMTGENNPAKRPEVRAKLSAARKGKNLGMIAEKHPRSIDGRSSEPYCSRFNFQLKEQIRNRDNRTGVLCGKAEIQNGERLSVHHIDASKTQGCNGEKWYLCALCRSCNTKPDTLQKEFLIVSNLTGIDSSRSLHQ